MVGGAGYVIYAVKGGESRVISCRSVALPSCSDNVEAEILACLFLVEELCEWTRQIVSAEGSLPKVVIQGDILPVVKYFQFAGRLRRLDMTNPLEQIRTLVSLHIPHALFLYQSRIANIVADNLAGQASQFCRERYRRSPSTFKRGVEWWMEFTEQTRNYIICFAITQGGLSQLVSGLVHPSYNWDNSGIRWGELDICWRWANKVTRKHWEVTENVEVAWGYHLLEFITGGSCDVSIAMS